MPSYQCPEQSRSKLTCRKRNYGTSKSFVVTMHLPGGFTHIHSQIKPLLHFSESFTLINKSYYKSYLSKEVFIPIYCLRAL